MKKFTVVPQFTWQLKTGFKVDSSDTETGKQYRYYRGKKPREWQLEFSGNPDIIDEVISFYQSCKGTFESFYWVPPKELNMIKVHFKTDELAIDSDGYVYGSLSLIIQEILG